MGRTRLKNLITSRHFLIAFLVACLAGSLGASAYGKQKIKVVKEKPKKHKKVQKAEKTNIEAAAEPDKILYERALNSMKHSKYTEARLELQTLINTYPDSEYLAKAKLAIADSFYKEGGVANLTQAIDAYKSFIVFFPFLDEAQYAQLQVAMCHYRMMLKPDRDPTEADAAESEFQNFLLKYPQSPLIPNAEQDLRNVQEVIADGEYRIGRFYYLKPDYAAAAARLMEVAERYPLYSNTDDALWMLGNIYMIDRKYTKNEDVKNKWADYASKCYRRILRDYPLSTHAAEAREQLKSLGKPIPSADPLALARMQQDQRFEKKHHELFVISWPKDILFSSPSTVDAARVGTPNLTPPDDTISATDVLKPEVAPPPTFKVAAAPATASNSDNSGGDAVPIAAEPQSQVDNAPSTGVGAQIISTGGADTNGNSAPAESAAPAATPAGTPAAAPAGTSVLAPVGSDTGNSTLENSAPGNSATPTGTASAASGNSSDPPATPSAPAAAGADAPSGAAPNQTTKSVPTSASKPAAQPKAPKVDPKTESSSNKKHGLHKIVPW
jgi:outer membrane protein assembly factor BamD